MLATRIDGVVALDRLRCGFGRVATSTTDDEAADPRCRLARVSVGGTTTVETVGSRVVPVAVPATDDVVVELPPRLSDEATGREVVPTVVVS